MESDGHEKGIKGVDLGCGLRRVGVWVGMRNIIKTKEIKAKYHTKFDHKDSKLHIALASSL